jgi:hypothetical protein
MFWADEDMQLLAGSPLHAAVLAQKKQALDWHTLHIVPTVRVLARFDLQRLQPHALPADVLLWARRHRDTHGHSA